MKNVKWDGKKRVANFFETFFGVKNAKKAAIYFWTSLVRRQYQPGCIVDRVIVLDGPQGIGKSMALYSIAHGIGGGYAEESADAFFRKDKLMSIDGLSLVEIVDLDQQTKANVAALKVALTARNDRYRESYSSSAKDHPRTFIVVGTSNVAHAPEDGGNRRFWPIRCKQKIDIKGIKKQRNQLLAEAASIVKAEEVRRNRIVSSALKAGAELGQ